MSAALDSLAVQAPLIVVLLLAVAGLFTALQKINNGTIDDLRKSRDKQGAEAVKALAELKDGYKEQTIELRALKDEVKQLRTEMRGGD